MRGWAGQLERLKISERTQRGKKYLARHGQLTTGGTAAYGFNLVHSTDNGQKKVTWAINLNEAEIVKRIFLLVADKGYTAYRVALELNQEQIPAPRAEHWNNQSIYQILTNPSYYGDSYLFRRKSIEPKVHVAGPRRNKKSSWYSEINPNGYQYLTSSTGDRSTMELFDKVQQQLKANSRKAPRNRVHQYLFSGGILRCGICGHAMTTTYRAYPAGRRLPRLSVRE